MVDPSFEGLNVFFKYRFITFEWKSALNAFVPLRFECRMHYDKIHSTFNNPQRYGNVSIRTLQAIKFG